MNTPRLMCNLGYADFAYWLPLFYQEGGWSPPFESLLPQPAGVEVVTNHIFSLKLVSTANSCSLVSASTRHQQLNEIFTQANATDLALGCRSASILDEGLD
jgi:hypothetical protein